MQIKKQTKLDSLHLILKVQVLKLLITTYQFKNKSKALTGSVPGSSVLRAPQAIVFQSRPLLLCGASGVPVKQPASKALQFLEGGGRASVLATGRFSVSCHSHAFTL